VLSVAFSILVVAVALVPPAIAQRIVDGVFVPSVREGTFTSRTTLLLSLIAGLVAANVLRAGLIFLRNNSVEVYSQRAQRDLKQRLYDHIQAQSERVLDEGDSRVVKASLAGGARPEDSEEGPSARSTLPAGRP